MSSTSGLIPIKALALGLELGAPPSQKSLVVAQL